MSDDNQELEHPALKDFSPGVETAKHIAGKTVKGAAVGALVGGAGLAAAVSVGAIAAVPFGGLLAAAGLATGIGTEWALGAIASTALTGATVGAGGGAAVGAVMGASNSEEAVDQMAEDKKARYDQAEIRHQQAENMKMAQYQQEAAMQVHAERMGLAPTQGLPQKPMGGPGIAT